MEVLSADSENISTGFFPEDIPDEEASEKNFYGESYIGEWKLERRIAQDAFYWSNSDGRACLLSAQNDSYSGDMRSGLPNGAGTMKWRSGAEYAGEFRKGARHGMGMYFYPNNDIYYGRWESGRRNGYGIYYFSNGDKYSGEFRNGKRYGKGIKVFLNGTSLAGSWNGKFCAI